MARTEVSYFQGRVEQAKHLGPAGRQDHTERPCDREEDASVVLDSASHSGLHEAESIQAFERAG